MRVRRLLSVWTAKLISAVCKMAGKQGVTLAGKVALKIDPAVLRDLSAQVRKEIFVVCGTNGKTTTNNLLCSALEAEGQKVVCNHTGSNMLPGVAAAFALCARPDGRLDADYACIEIDEASAVRVFPHFRPDYMVLTNLFRDQLDRYGEIDITMKLLDRAMKMAPDMKVIVNADDALSWYLAEESGHPCVTYGISEKMEDVPRMNEIREGRFCKRCGEKLEYEFYHYSQIGKYRCPNCGFARPEADFDASGISLRDGITFTAEGRTFHVGYRGFYNVYNVLAAYSAARTAGFALQNFGRMLSGFNPQNGRMERFRVGDTEIVLNLAKNPAGFNQNISAVLEDRNQKDIIIVINDNAQDGLDISWLWDVDFDRLCEDSIRTITVSGIRCQDMRLRLKYVDIASELIPDVETAVRARLKDGCGNLYVLVNYTALYSTRNILAQMEKTAGRGLKRPQKQNQKVS